MAIIGKIRKHSWLLVVIIGVALAGFVLQDFWRKSNSGRGGVEFAEIAGEKIAKVDFDVKVAEQEELYMRQTGKDQLTPAENFDIMIRAWDALEREIIMQKEFEKLGLAIEHEDIPKAGISPEELYDLITGNFLHPYIIQSFSDPNTGQVNRQAIQQYLQRFDELKDEEKMQWKQLEEGIKEDRINTKYNTMIAQGYYIPDAFAKRMYEESNRAAAVKIVGVKYQTISDSLITVTDEDYQKYYDEHSYEYEVDATCDIDYVVWEVLPSEADRKKVDEEIANIYAEFQTAELTDIATFINARSDQMYDSNYVKKGSLPVQMDSIMFSAPLGTTIAPYVENNVYYMSRLVNTMMRPDSMKASHILIMFKDAPGLNPQANITRSKEQAKITADSIMAVLKARPELFGQMVLDKSEYPSADQDTGNLNWFTDGDPNMMFFYDSCFSMKPGDMRVILSNLGYHVLYLTAKTQPVNKARVAILTREIKPSSQTFNDYYTKASEFAGAYRTKDEFNAGVAAKGLNVRNGQFIREMTYSLPGVEYSREVIRWAFDEKTEVGQVAPQVFDAQGKYVVAMLKDRRQKGIATLDQVKTYIEPLVKREKKAEKILADVNTALGSTQDLTALAMKFNTKVDTVAALTLASVNLPNYGPEPTIVGTVFTLKPNTVSKALKGDMAVYVVKLDGIIEPPANTNFSMMKSQMISFFYQRIQNSAFKAIKDETEIIDNRIFYY
jgi:peptidyl-prolyl cis-trans isomerase D